MPWSEETHHKTKTCFTLLLPGLWFFYISVLMYSRSRTKCLPSMSASKYKSRKSEGLDKHTATKRQNTTTATTICQAHRHGFWDFWFSQQRHQLAGFCSFTARSESAVFAHWAKWWCLTIILQLQNTFVASDSQMTPLHDMQKMIEFFSLVL